MPKLRLLLPILAILASFVSMPLYDALVPGTTTAPIATPPSAFLPSAYGVGLLNRKSGDDAMTVFASRAGLVGLCGGFSYAAVDYYRSGRAAPNGRRFGEVTTSQRTLERYLAQRQQASLLANGPRFAAWSLRPDRPTWWAKAGVGEQTRRVELPLLERQLANGPVPLGLVRSKGLLDLGKNHQVVAYGVERRGRKVRVRVYDPNQPLANDVSLEFDASDAAGRIRGMRGDRLLREWRGFFVERYVPADPPE